MDIVERVILVLMIFGLGCLFGSYTEVQGRGLDGKSIERCVLIVKGGK